MRENYEMVLSDFDLSDYYTEDINDPSNYKKFNDITGSSKYLAPELWDMIEN